MTDRARGWLESLLTMRTQGGKDLVLEAILADLSRVGLDPIEVGWCLRHLFGLSMAEAVYRATEYQASIVSSKDPP